MKPLEVDVVAAPKRGRYDRALTRRERQGVQRERVIAAISALSATQRELNIANVVELAGIGRNTFYEYFDDIEHALVAMKSRAVRELATQVDAALSSARTPLERVRGLSRAWSNNLFEGPVLAQFALRAQAEAIDATQLSVLSKHVAEVLAADVDSRSALPGLADRLRVLAVAALFDAVSRAHLSVQPMSREELQRALADLSLRLLR